MEIRVTGSNKRVLCGIFGKIRYKYSSLIIASVVAGGQWKNPACLDFDMIVDEEVELKPTSS